MATPRFQCLNVAKQVTKSRKGLRAAFSTSQNPRSDEPRKTSATDDLLRVVGESPSSQSRANSASDLFNHLKNARQTPTPSFNFAARKSSASLNSNPIQPRSTLPKTHYAGMQNLLENFNIRREESQQSTSGPTSLPDEFNRSTLATDLSKRMWRRWKAGDTYAPHDLSYEEQMKWSKRKQPFYDSFDLLAMNPLDHYRNFSIMSEFMSPMGRIKHRSQTGLRPVNQRKIAKAIRRAVGIGMMPSVHRHPELLYASRKNYEGVHLPSRGRSSPL